MSDWPLASIRPLDGSFQETPVPNFVDDRAEVGAPRRRARFSRTLRMFTFRHMLTTAEKEVLETFYYTILGGGVASFNWIHPDSRLSRTVRFSADGMKIAHRSASEAHGDLWDVDIALEEI